MFVNPLFIAIIIVIWVVIIIVLWYFMRALDEEDTGLMGCPYCKQNVRLVCDKRYSTPPGVMMEMHMTVWGCPNCGNIIDEDFY